MLSFLLKNNELDRKLFFLYNCSQNMLARKSSPIFLSSSFHNREVLFLKIPTMTFIFLGYLDPPLKVDLIIHNCI